MHPCIDFEAQFVVFVEQFCHALYRLLRSFFYCTLLHIYQYLDRNFQIHCTKPTAVVHIWHFLTFAYIYCLSVRISK